MRTIACLIMSVIIMTSCKITNFQKGIKGNGKMVTKEITIEDYNKISIGSQFDLIYTMSETDKPYLKIEIDENLLDYLSVEVVDETLKINTSEDIKPKHNKIYTNSTALKRISTDGISNVILQDSITSDSLTLSISGIGKITAKNLNIQYLDASLSGIGDIILAGEVTNATLNISGKGDIKAYELRTLNSNCNVSGIGDINIYTSEKLTANVSGIGKIRYKGNPKEKEVSSSGIGSVKEKK